VAQRLKGDHPPNEHGSCARSQADYPPAASYRRPPECLSGTLRLPPYPPLRCGLVGAGRSQDRPGPRQRLRGSNPAQCCSAVRGRSGGPPLTCDPHSPIVPARARRGPAVPDAARTQHGPGSQAWKARPVPPSRPDPTPMAQVRAACCRPLLTVSDRQLPMLRAHGGHGRRDQPRSSVTATVTS
jgi:hypothetical protein